ncbi:MAG: nitronate monooxygenase [Acuticoccus sp.]
MAGACPPELAAAVSRAGGMGAGGMTGQTGEGIAEWSSAVRASSNGPFMLNLWTPDPPPARDRAHEAAVRDFLAAWRPALPEDAADTGHDPDFDAQCAALIAAGPSVVSSIMGLYPAPFAARLRERGIRWWATVTTVAEAEMAAAAGADAIIAQGMEAGGHRGAFDAEKGEAQTIGLAALVPAVADAVSVPVIAAGGIADGRGAAAALVLGASAVIVGTALLRAPEAGVIPGWADAIARARPEDTTPTRAFTGRLGRALRTRYVEAAADPAAPAPAPFPVQRAFTAPMRAAAMAAGDVGGVAAWAGQSAHLARAEPAADIVQRIWDETQAAFGV